MAEPRRRTGAISKGMKVTAVVEDAMNDMLVISLNVGSRHFRGILLDASKRNIPHGLHFPPVDKDDEKKEETPAHSHQTAPEFEHPATTFRHTYLKPTENTNNSSQVQLHTFPRPFKDRQGRNIRLRPRSTLCSKCKAVCHETDKGIIPVGQGAKQVKMQIQTNTQPSNLPRAKSPQREGLRKRQLISSSSNAKSVADKTSMGITRSSPFIKINIGEGTVLQIPPRLHDEVDGESNTSQTEDNIDSASNCQDSDLEQKDAKLPKKIRERSSQSSISVDDSDSVPATGAVEVANHHKKHKRKHKHKRDSLENDEKFNTVPSAVDENVENPDIQNEVPTQRPRLLYTWRQNKGLSPRRENMDSNISLTHESFSPKDTVDSSSAQDLEVHAKVIVRSKSVDMGPKKEYKLRSREKRVSTDSADSVCTDHKSVSDFDKYSMISSATEDESESVDLEMDKSSVDEDVPNPQEPPPIENTQKVDVFRSLMMKIHTRDVTKCIAPDGRTIHVGDIVWGKIKGFPWWPGRVLSISVSERDSGIVIRKLAHVSWFGSSTMSHIQCSDLYPFLEDFKLRYNRKKRGSYKVAIKQATIAAQSITNTHQIDFSQFGL